MEKHPPDEDGSSFHVFVRKVIDQTVQLGFRHQPNYTVGLEAKLPRWLPVVGIRHHPHHRFVGIVGIEPNCGSNPFRKGGVKATDKTSTHLSEERTYSVNQGGSWDRMSWSLLRELRVRQGFMAD
jgi:hypothetical protein